MLLHLAEQYDLIIVDTAPVLMASDALTVALHAGAIFTVVRAGISTVDEVEEAVGQLNAAGASIAGVVFNGHYARPGAYGGYSRYGRYGSCGRTNEHMHHARHIGGSRAGAELLVEGSR
jgi:tyrosine-protein kinase Etk/Wzc